MSRTSLRRQLRALRYKSAWLNEAVFTAQRMVRRVSGRPFEPEFALIPELGLPSDAVFVDVGTNRGQSIDAIRAACPGAVVHSFEANPEMQRHTARFAGVAGVTIRFVGLGDTEGSFDLLVPDYDGVPLDALSSLNEADILSFFEGGNFQGYRKEKLEIRKVTCRVERLDSFDLAPGFIKLDVQGAEEIALRGGARTLAEHLPAVLLESQPEPSKTLLGLGYGQFKLVGDRLHPVTDPEMQGSNSLFLHDRHRSALANRLM